MRQARAFAGATAASRARARIDAVRPARPRGDRRLDVLARAGAAVHQPLAGQLQERGFVGVRTAALEQHRFVGLESAGRELAQDFVARPRPPRAAGRGPRSGRSTRRPPRARRASSRAPRRGSPRAAGRWARGRTGPGRPSIGLGRGCGDVAGARAGAWRCARPRGCDYPGRLATPARRGVSRQPVIAARIGRQLRCVLDVKAQAVSPTTRCASEAPTDTPRWSRAEPFPLREERRRDPSRPSRSISAPRSPSSAACCRRCCCSRS